MKTIWKTFVTALLLIIICESSFYGQNKYNLSQFWHETGNFIKTPAGWDGYDWLKLGLVGGGTLIVYQFDQRIFDKASSINVNNPTYRDNFVLTVGDEWGGFFVGPLLCVSLYATGSLANSDKTKKMGFEIGQALLYTEAISFTSKQIIGRSRPYTGRGPSSFKPFSFFYSPDNSFPAGHVGAAMALSTVLSKNTSSGILKVVAYIPAALTMISRIYPESTGNGTSRHWGSDVFIAGALGYFVGNWVVNQHNQIDSRVKVTSIYPVTLAISLN